MAPLTVAILAVPGAIALDLSIPAHLFGAADGYQVIICGESGSVPIAPTRPLTAAADADLIVVPGYEQPEQPLPTPYLDLLAGSSTRIVGICTGTFALAAAGLLKGRDATTHWQYVAPLRRLHPRINVLENRLYVEAYRKAARD